MKDRKITFDAGGRDVVFFAMAARVVSILPTDKNDQKRVLKYVAEILRAAPSR